MAWATAALAAIVLAIVLSDISRRYAILQILFGNLSSQQAMHYHYAAAPRDAFQHALCQSIVYTETPWVGHIKCIFQRLLDEIEINIDDAKIAKQLKRASSGSMGEPPTEQVCFQSVCEIPFAKHWERRSIKW